MKMKYYKIGAVFGHCGSGNGIQVCIPILAANIVHALKQAEKTGGIKKSFRNFWYAKEVDKWEFNVTKLRWENFKTAVKPQKNLFQ